MSYRGQIRDCLENYGPKMSKQEIAAVTKIPIKKLGYVLSHMVEQGFLEKDTRFSLPQKLVRQKGR